MAIPNARIATTLQYSTVAWSAPQIYDYCFMLGSSTFDFFTYMISVERRIPENSSSTIAASIILKAKEEASMWATPGQWTPITR